MRRTRHDLFALTAAERYLVQQDMFRKVIACERLPPGTNLRAAVDTATARLEKAGWKFDSNMNWGFAFLRRGSERALLLLTERNPDDDRSQSFDPHRPPGSH